MRALVRILLPALMFSAITARFWLMCEPLRGWRDLLLLVVRALIPGLLG